MNAKTHAGHWADSRRLHSDAMLGPNARFLDLDDEHLRTGKANLPMAFVALVTVLFPLLLVGVGSLAILILRAAA